MATSIRSRHPRAPYGSAKYASQSMKDSQVSIPRLREAISSLDSKVASLMLQRVELESHLEHAVRSQSPVNRLPAEILAEIFEIGVLAKHDNAPLMVSTLLLVCRFWRDVGINTPSLWTKILVSPHSSTKKIRLMLTRSKSSPLDITFSFESRSAPMSTVLMECIVHAMDLLKPALWRTRTFHIYVPHRPHAHAILSRCQQETPLLEEFSVHIEHSIQDDRGLPSAQLLFNGNTPRLQYCSFSSFNFGWDLSLLSNLRILKLGGYISGAPSPATLLQILRNCPALEEFALRNISAYDGGMFFPKEEVTPPTSTRVVHLPRLRKISFYYSGATLTNYIMTNVWFPALEDLELYYLENATPILKRLYEQALTHLPLRRLHIESCQFSELQFASLIHKSASLTSLELVDIEDVSSALLKNLSTIQPVPCPRLQNLVLDQCTSFNWDSLRTFVETRFFLASRAHMPSTRGSSCASTAAALHAWTQAHTPHGHHFPPPSRLESIDVTRCTQLGKEMTQWLRMYIPNVVSHPGKNTWE